MGLKEVNDMKEGEIAREDASADERSLKTKTKNAVQAGVKKAREIAVSGGEGVKKFAGGVKGAFIMSEAEYEEKEAKKGESRERVSSGRKNKIIASHDTITDMGDDGRMNDSNMISSRRGRHSYHSDNYDDVEMMDDESPPRKSLGDRMETIKGGFNKVVDFAEKVNSRSGGDPLSGLGGGVSTGGRDPLAGLVGLNGENGGGNNDPLAGLLGGVGGGKGGSDPLAGLLGGVGGGKGGSDPLAMLNAGIGGSKAGKDPLAALTGGFGGKHGGGDPMDMLSGLTGLNKSKKKVSAKKKKRKSSTKKKKGKKRRNRK